MNIKKSPLFAALAFACALSSHANADYALPAFGIDRTTPAASPVCIMSGALCKVLFGTANLSTGAWTLPSGVTIPGLPGLTTNIQGTGTPGLDFSTTSCTGDACGWMLYAAPSNYPDANPALLRVQKSFPATGGHSGWTYSTAWIVGTTGQNDAGYIWNLKSELNNKTAGATGAQNVAISGTARDVTDGITLPYSYAPIWGLYGEAYDASGQVNPNYAIHGGEIDAYVNVGAGTDANKQRVMLQLAGGVQGGTDSGVHIGRGLLIGTNGGAVLDNAIEVNEGTIGFNTFLVEGSGATIIHALKGGWANDNAGKGLLVTTNTGANNPAIGVSDSNLTNWWALANYGGELRVQTMPALTDSTTAPSIVALFKRTGDVQIGNGLTANEFRLGVGNKVAFNWMARRPIAVFLMRQDSSPTPRPEPSSRCRTQAI
ncbi:hypothetical protein [Methylosinus sporium]|uniref:hypothetical protein n=1 Tax=Methylosinus sporium TaxID=428 RepID=UPI003839F65C